MKTKTVRDAMRFLWFGNDGKKEEKLRQLTEDLARSKAIQRVPEKNEELETAYNCHLLLAGALINHDCVASGKAPEEVMGSYERVMELLRDWFTGKDTKERLNILFKEALKDKWEVKTEEWPIKVRGIRPRE